MINLYLYLDCVRSNIYLASKSTLLGSMFIYYKTMLTYIMQLLSQLNIWVSGCVVVLLSKYILIFPAAFGTHLQHLTQWLCTLQGFLMARQWKRPPAWGLGWEWCIHWMKLWLPVRLPLVWILWGLCSGCRGPGGRRGQQRMGSRMPGWRLGKERRVEVWCGRLLGGHSSGSCHLLGCISVVRRQ